MRIKIAFLFICLAHLTLLAHSVVPHHHHGEFVSAKEVCEHSCNDTSSHHDCDNSNTTTFSTDDHHTHRSCAIEKSFVTHVRTHGRHVSSDESDTHFCFCALCGIFPDIPHDEGTPLSLEKFVYITHATQPSAHDISQRGPPSQ